MSAPNPSIVDLTKSDATRTSNTGYNCMGCAQADYVDDMVACDDCSVWWHYFCAGVGKSVAEKSFRCKNCTLRRNALCPSVVSCESTTSAKLRLKQLEEAKALDDRLLLEKAERERAFLAAKHDLEAEIANKSSRSSVASFYTHSSRSRSVRSWVDDQNQQTDFTLPDTDGKTSTPVTTNAVVPHTTPRTLPTGTNFRTKATQATPHLLLAATTVTSSVMAGPVPTAFEQVPTSVASVRNARAIEWQKGPAFEPIVYQFSAPTSTYHGITQPLRSSQPSTMTSVGLQTHPPLNTQFGMPQPSFHPPQLSGIMKPPLQANPPVTTMYGYHLSPSSMVQTRPEEQTGYSAYPQVGSQAHWFQFGQAQSHQQQLHRTTSSAYSTVASVSAPSLPPLFTTIASIPGPSPRPSCTITTSIPGPPLRPPNSIAACVTMQQPRPPYSTVSYVPASQPQPPCTTVPYVPAPQPEPPYPTVSYVPTSVYQPPCSTAPYVPASQFQPPYSTFSYVPEPPPQPPYYVLAGAEGAISAQQLAARHVVSRDLPKFSGDPLEWPMFINAFESTTAICGIQPDENLARLQKSLVGKAREKVLSILTLPTAVPEIIETLRDECGRPEQLVHCLLSKVRNAPTPNINRLETLVTFGREVKNLVTFIHAANLQAHLSNPMLLTELVGKLPPSLRLEWGLHAQKIPQASLQAFSDYVSSIKTAACHVSLPVDSTHFSEERRGKKEKDAFINAHNFEDKRRTESNTKPANDKINTAAKPCPVCSKTDHKIRDCSKFIGFSVEERRKQVEQHSLCQRCLVGHGKWPCRTKQPCGVDDCKEQHHKLLHTKQPVARNVADKSGPSGVISTHCYHHGATLFRIVPVTLSYQGKSLQTFAFLDDGSSLTLLEDEVADELGLEGEANPLCLQWTGNVTRKEPSSRSVQLSISNLEGGQKFALKNARTVASLDLPKQSLDYGKLSERYPHLRGLPVQSFSNATPKILIGLDNAKLKLTLEKRERRIGEPVATKTRLGWVIFGGSGESASVPRLMVHECGCSEDATLHELVKDFFAVENVGATGMLPESAEDQRARKILQDTTRRTESGRFESGLLWKSDDIALPNSYPMAMRRLVCLEKKLAKDPELEKKVADQIAEYQERGYAHKATESELQDCDSRRVWYLPLGVVQNPRKPNKIRVVWDAAARVDGVSLNSVLLKGPDLLTPLLSVLCRFRQRQYAVAGDIRQMFHQLLIKDSDRHAQRFLWRADPKADPDIFIMDVATFGATCSPCSAQYAKNLNAQEFQEKYPEAAAAVIENTYVDDYLDSRDTIDEAARIAEEVKLIHSKAGFEIRGWQSNSGEILERVGGECCNEAKLFSAEKATVAERVLGMTWMPQDDDFVFLAQFRDNLLPLLPGNTVPTKRQVLSVVMSLFDPLGIIATYTIHGKILIQDVWRSGVGWDDPIAEGDFMNWQRWLRLLPQLTKVRISRCYFPNYSPESFDTLQLHVFVDASELAYCAVAYFRIMDHGVARSILVAAKTKVTPLKPQSIPRNELNAGVIGVRLMKSIEENHTLPVKKRFIWTDSSTVLSWLRADPRKYRQYVAFRISEILTDSNIEEWRWVPTRMNVADEATKWGTGPNLDPGSRWFSGPDFLLSPEAEWPTAKPVLQEPLEEIRASQNHHHVHGQSLFEFDSFSDLKDLIKKLSYVHHFVHRCRAKKRTSTGLRSTMLTREDYAAAEKSLWRMVQAEEFPREIATLKANTALLPTQRKRLEKTSPLAKLSPFVDEDGVLRMESRINPATALYSFDFCNPVILPKQHRISELVILRFHERFGHANTDTVVNELRQRYHIPKVRSAVKKAVKNCMWCRVYRAKPKEPRMAPLPQPRVQPFVRAFTFTGLDYFGPLIVKRGRANVKRWVALFTCLTVRAVHLEVVHTLSTRSCRMAIQRFVDKRGSPQSFFSDNGTCFRGAAREFAEESKAINRAIAPSFVNSGTEWCFNPPSAPHMGGVWERKVRSIKEAFKVLAHPDRLDDEELLTYLAEAEMIVNSHPLTFVALDSPTDAVITPNHFLILNPSGASDPTRTPVDRKIPLRTNWKTMQELLDQFWNRWIQGYLPTIARRTKWFSNVRPLEKGDCVVIVDEAVRNGWLRGRIVQTYPGKDGQVRKVDVETPTGLLQRPATKVALLDILEDGKTT